MRLLVLEPVHNLPLCTRSVERRQDDVTRLFRIEMVGTTENVEVHCVLLRVRVHRKMRLGQHEHTSDTERLKLVERPADDSQIALVCNLFHQRLNLVNVLEVDA